MRQFERVKSIMGTKDSRRIIKTYNRVAKTLMEFEALWHQAWLMSVDSVRQVCNTPSPCTTKQRCYTFIPYVMFEYILILGNFADLLVCAYEPEATLAAARGFPILSEHPMIEADAAAPYHT